MKLYRHAFAAMGCPCEIGVFSDSAARARQAICAAQTEVERLDRKYSHFRRDSYISRVQQAARRPAGVTVDNETAALLDYAETQFRLSNGLFDITAGRLTRLWRARTRLPSKGSLARALRLTGWKKISWQKPKLSLPREMALELGGVVKEYAADRAALQFRRLDIRSAFVELGGDLHVTGPHPDGQPWNMGIRHPAHRRSRYPQAIAGIPVSQGGLATSGDYERYSLIDGQRYGHIVNPVTGWPVQGFRSVSVLAPTCLLAGSISTLASLLGITAGRRWLDNCGFPWLALTTDGISCGRPSAPRP